MLKRSFPDLAPVASNRSTLTSPSIGTTDG
jgi:hypothetical protein